LCWKNRARTGRHPLHRIRRPPPAKQQIACTRSFGRPITELYELREAITEFACRAAEKLRKKNSHTGQLMAFIRTSPFVKKSYRIRTLF
jgi:DNA polymerase V